MSKNGFAMLEMLLIAGMLAVLSGIVLPRLDFCRSQRADYEAACLAADLRYLQEISRNEKSCRPGIPGYEVPSEPPYMKVEQHRYSIRELERDHAVREHQAPRDVYFGTESERDSTRIMFSSDGDILNNTRTIHIWMPEQHRAVIIDQAGRIRVEWRSPREWKEPGT